jgi:hypothetical protein
MLAAWQATGTRFAQWRGRSSRSRSRTGGLDPPPGSGGGLAALDGALAHIGERLEVERRIAENIRETRDRAQESERRAKAASLIELLEECQNRHMILQRKLMEARQIFLLEQQRQVFAPPASVRLRDITCELLLPVLSLPLLDADAPAVGFFERVLSPRSQRFMRLSTLIAQLLAPPRERAELGAELLEPELRELTPYEAFPEPVREAAEAVIAQVDSQPRRLSALLAAALDHSPATAHLVALLALHSFSPALESQLRAGDEAPLLLAWSDGTLLPPQLRLSGGAPGDLSVASAGQGGPSFYGDDLLLARVDLAAHLSEVRT